MSGSDDVTLRAQTLLTPYDVLSPGWVTVRGSVVSAVGAGDPPSGVDAVDLADRILVPGFVDLHVHGGLDAPQIQEVAEFQATHGTTALLATTMTDSLERLEATIAAIGECVRRSDPMGAAVLGAHLEGPWISPQRAGAHDPRFLCSPNLGDLRHLLDSMPGVIRVVTVAPELPGAMALIQALVASRVVAAVGHTDADAAMVEAAFEAGATHVTHLFNAMPPMHHRQPGPVGAALADERVTVEVIADGVHLDPRILRVVLRAAAGRVVAVTDAVSAGDRVVQDAAGHMVLAESPQTLAGSTLTLDRAVAALVEAGASLPEAVTAASATPARVIGADRHGVLRPGARADLAVLGADLRCTATMVGGHVVYDPDGVLS